MAWRHGLYRAPSCASYSICLQTRNSCCGLMNPSATISFGVPCLCSSEHGVYLQCSQFSWGEVVSQPSHVQIVMRPILRTSLIWAALLHDRQVHAYYAFELQIYSLQIVALLLLFCL